MQLNGCKLCLWPYLSSGLFRSVAKLSYWGLSWDPTAGCCHHKELVDSLWPKEKQMTSLLLEIKGDGGITKKGGRKP